MLGLMLDMDNSDVDNKIMECIVGREICVDDGREVLDSYQDRDLNSYQDRDLSVGELNVEPHVGMEFKSEEAAMVYYDSYAKRVGFIVRVGNCHRSGRDRTITTRRFLCNREGFRAKDKKKSMAEIRKPRESTRDGCKAMIMVKRENSERWIMTKLETQHSHPLGIPSGKVRRGQVQARPQDEKDKEIKVLSADLHRSKKQLAECKLQLETVLKEIEQHTSQLSRIAHVVVENLNEVEQDDQG